MRDELLNGELFYSLKEAQIIIENWRRHCNYSATNWMRDWRQSG
jgi:hypothetical protein